MPLPIGEPSGITAAQPASSSRRASTGSSLVYGSTVKPSATSVSAASISSAGSGRRVRPPARARPVGARHDLAVDRHGHALAGLGSAHLAHGRLDGGVPRELAPAPVHGHLGHPPTSARSPARSAVTCSLVWGASSTPL